jgi:uncharacterized protein YaaR (DUF327 family)
MTGIGKNCFKRYLVLLFLLILLAQSDTRSEVMSLEVNKVGRSTLDKTKAKQNSSLEKTTFTEVMASKRTDLVVEKLKKLMEDIEEQGNILAESQTVEDLRKYKKLVKEFLDESVKNGLQLEERRGFNRRGRTKIYKIVTEVDKKLLELTDAVLNKQEKGLKILELVGEIKGLLINVYA